MKRTIRLCLLTMFLGMLAITGAYSQTKVLISGVIPEDSVRVLLKDNVYALDHQLLVKGALIIEPGTHVEFYTEGRIVVAPGGRLIADGFAKTSVVAHPPQYTQTPGPYNYPNGYNDLNCFLGSTAGGQKFAGLTTEEMRYRERTINPKKNNHIFNVVLNKATRRLENIQDPSSGNWPTAGITVNANGIMTGYAYDTKVGDNNKVIIPFETAILFWATRMNEDWHTNNALKDNTWERIGGKSVDIVPEQIHFLGQPQNDNSREWGHIIVMPGARAAFFRNCEFKNFKKDVGVDIKPYFAAHDGVSPDSLTKVPYQLTPVELTKLNDGFIKLTNGSGGALTTFSSRTWLVNCEFENNFARLRGGAVQVLQSPTSLFIQNLAQYTKNNPFVDTVGIERFSFDASTTEARNQTKNGRITDAADYTSTVMNRNQHLYERYPKIDKIDDATDEFFGDNDLKRMPWDDARLAGYLGRFRNLTFEDNTVRLATPKYLVDESGKTVWKDDLRNEAAAVVPYPHQWGNMAYGGAMYISGTEDETRQIEFGLGVNDQLKLGDNLEKQNPNAFIEDINFKDYLVFRNNKAVNLQKELNTEGAKGGAIYVGKNTSLIIAGQFENNYTDARWLVNTTPNGEFTNGKATPAVNGTLYSLGGAIYSDPQSGRLQVRGDIIKDNMKVTTTGRGTETKSNPTHFIGNTAGAGAAIYVATSNDVLMSPQIGGADVDPTIVNYGHNIQFDNNKAYTAGGAIFTARNTEINGAGGKYENYSYSDLDFVRFTRNEAGFSGGAMHIEIPVGSDINNMPNTKIFNIRRAKFDTNRVNFIAFRDSATHVNWAAGTQKEVRGGGAIYALWADPNVVRAAEFKGNEVYNGNGAGIAVINPFSRIDSISTDNLYKVDRFFLSDLDEVQYADLPVGAPEGTPAIANDYFSVNNPFTMGANLTDADALRRIEYLPEYHNGELVLDAGKIDHLHVNMLTLFDGNKTVVDETRGQEQINNYGATQMGGGYIMPNQSITSQWWFSPDEAFVVGSEGTLIRIYKDIYNKWVWTPAYNDSLWHAHNLTDVQFTSSLNGYIADNFGMIHRTTDKGNTWTTVLNTINISSVVETINDIDFISGASEQGLAVTTAGRIYRTMNGTTWTNYAATWNKNLNGVNWVNGNIAFVVGSEGTIIKTTDAGLTWTSQYVPGMNKNLTKVYFTSVNDGFAIGEQGAMVKTNNGGDAWTIVTGVFGGNETLTDIAFYGNSIGYVTTNKGNVYKTTNAGATWNKLTYTTASAINNVFVLDDQTTMLVGDHDFVAQTKDAANNFEVVLPYDRAQQLGNPRLHGEIPNLVENGIGLGGAMYILDFQNNKSIERKDAFNFNRTRWIFNEAFTGSAIYSDNFNLKLLMNRSLIRGNKTDIKNTIGKNQNAIDGPFNRDPQYVERNDASSDLAAATIYGEIQGPFPTNKFSTLANSIFENDARFLIRLPDAPNSKGMATGQSGAGTRAGTDTLIGNYWGKTQANVGISLMNLHHNNTGTALPEDKFMTFFVEKTIDGVKLKADKNYLPYYNKDKSTDLRKQGPFEYNLCDYSNDKRENLYTYIELDNAPIGVTNREEIPADLTIPEKYLFSFDIYDLHDKGTDIKTADYSKRRMFPIEDFAVGNTPYIVRNAYQDVYYTKEGGDNNRYVQRLVRNPEMVSDIAIAALQRTWAPYAVQEDGTPLYYHPLGMPMYLEALAPIAGEWQRINRDERYQGSTVFFVINESTGDYIRVDLKQIKTNDIYSDSIYRSTVFFVPDSLHRNKDVRRAKENLRTLGSNGTAPFGGYGNMEMLKKLSPRTYYTDLGYTEKALDSAAENEDYAALIGRKYTTRSQYEGRNFNLFGTNPFLYSNNFHDINNGFAVMPDDNLTTSNTSDNTYFAGERYGTLPVNDGDVIRVISRNILWKYGENAAYAGGLVFKITDTTAKPHWTGDLVMYNDPEKNPYMNAKAGGFPVHATEYVDENGVLQPDTVKNYDLLNKVFLTTNRTYPANSGTYSGLNAPTFPQNLRGTDVILTLTAADWSNLYDPRSEWTRNGSDVRYTALDYKHYPQLGEEPLAGDPGLKYWMMVDTVYKDITVDNYLSTGYLRFKGQPLNPYIVPGGEKLRVTASNYVPGVVTWDSLAKVDPLTGSDFLDKIPFLYETYPAYLNTPYYNQNTLGQLDMTARYLQQDTIAMRPSVLTNDPGDGFANHLTIFVQDEFPRFIQDENDPTDVTSVYLGQTVAFNDRAMATGQTFKVKDVTSNDYIIKDYTPSTFTAGRTLKPIDPFAKVLVNVTDKLRFKMDLNTDDELEDASAAEKGWDFRYGKTSYGFANLGLSSEDSVAYAIDSVIVDGVNDDYRIVGKLRPSFFANETYYKQYNDINVTDNYLEEFVTKGQMNIRIDRAEADNYLLKRAGEDGVLRPVWTVDTVMAIVANDGHGAISTKYIDLYVNYQPTFLTADLPAAIEGVEYNIKRDSIRAIRINDINGDQGHSFYLIDADMIATGTIALDPSFPTETAVNISTLRPAPEWLNIDTRSGILHGVPTLIRDMRDTLIEISVLVIDDDGLANIATIPFKTQTGNCPPEITIAPNMDCLVKGQEVNEPLFVFDRDLLRDGTTKEQLTLSVISPSDGLTIEPSTISGVTLSDTVEVFLKNTGSGFNYSITDIDPATGRLPVVVEVRDRKGAKDTLIFNVRVSNEVTFLSTITVTNTKGAFKKLQWGSALNASTGDGLDGYKPVGYLDEEYCEIEIPPLPNQDVFDARWAIPTKNGVYRNIYPTANQQKTPSADFRYRGTFQAGGESVSGVSTFYPVTLTWLVSTVPAIGDNTKNPTGSTWLLKDGPTDGKYFAVNMSKTNSRNISSNASFEQRGDTAILTIYDNRITNFQIVHDWYSAVEDGTTYTTKIVSVNPSPISSSTNNAKVTFEIAKAGNVYMEMLDVLGNKVCDITDGFYSEGQHIINLNLNSKLASGSYMIRMTSGTEISRIKLMVIE